MGKLLAFVERSVSRLETLFTIFQWTGLGKPVVSAVLMGAAIVISFFEKVPYTYLLVVAVGTFAMAMLALNQIDAWRDRNEVDDKLVFDHALVHCTVSRAKQAAGNQVANYQLAVVFKNTGKRDLWYTVKRIHSVINNQSVLRPKLETRSGLIPAGEPMEYRYAEIPDIDYSNPPLAGIIEFDIRYGSSARNLKFKLEEKYGFDIFWENEKIGIPTFIKVLRLAINS